MLAIISAGIAPGLALLSYLYLKDQYRNEPVALLFKTFILGAVFVFPIMFIQYVLEVEHIFSLTIYKAFLSTAMLEEFMKWFVLYYSIYQHVEFDDHYDGILYGASVSLGFATLENILYLFVNGIEFAIGRALLPVSSHALFGIIMGYYLGKGKFSEEGSRKKMIFLAFLVPFCLHGLHDYILMSFDQWVLWMIPFMIFLWWYGLSKVKQAHSISRSYM